MFLANLFFPETPDSQLVSRHNWLLVVPIVGSISTGSDSHWPELWKAFLTLLRLSQYSAVGLTNFFWQLMIIIVSATGKILNYAAFSPVLIFRFSVNCRDVSHILVDMIGSVWCPAFLGLYTIAFKASKHILVYVPLSHIDPHFWLSHFVQWVFTLGLGLSTVVDILITGSLFFLLKTSRTSNFKYGNFSIYRFSLIIPLQSECCYWHFDYLRLWNGGAHHVRVWLN